MEKEDRIPLTLTVYDDLFDYLSKAVALAELAAGPEFQIHSETTQQNYLCALQSFTAQAFDICLRIAPSHQFKNTEE